MRFSPLAMQFEIGISISRYLPPERYGRLGTKLGQRIEPLPATTPQD